MAAKLRARRDSLVHVADQFYAFVALVADIHGTDADDRATITRTDDRHVEVRLATPDDATYFDRTFDATETHEIRLYLHGGDDIAVIRGDVRTSIPVYVIGGNGNNVLRDSSRVGGRSHAARLYDEGSIRGENYGKDTLFNRRPLVMNFGHLVEPGPDRGAASSPIMGLSINHDMGFMPRIGLTKYARGFRHGPYASMLSLEGQYSFKIGGAAVTLTGDQRQESSPIHFTEVAQMSQLEIINWHGLGNSSPQSPGLTSNVTAPRTDFFSLNQRQWTFRPAIALATGPTADLSLGPILEYAVTDLALPTASSRRRGPTASVISARRGCVSRSSVIIAIRLAHQPWFGLNPTPERDMVSRSVGCTVARSGRSLDRARSYSTLPVPAPPHILGSEQGGRRSSVISRSRRPRSSGVGPTCARWTCSAMRAMHRSIRPRNSASPFARFTVILPLNTGLLATEDIGRVYVNGDSPGGWHNAFGAGFWVAFHDLSLDIRVMRADETGRPAVIALRLVAPGCCHENAHADSQHTSLPGGLLAASRRWRSLHRWRPRRRNWLPSVVPPS